MEHKRPISSTTEDVVRRLVDSRSASSWAELTRQYIEEMMKLGYDDEFIDEELDSYWFPWPESPRP